MMNFVGKAALITGSTTGIGEACAHAFAEAGASVMVTGRNEERGAAVVAALKSHGADAAFLACDVRADGIGDRLVSATVERFGALDILVNNAGVLSAGDVVETTEEQWREIVDVNITSLFVISKSAVVQMRKQGGGCIVNIASEWGLNGEPGYLAYCTSKGAVVQMTRCMSLDHAQEKIRVNSVCPGEVHTQMVDEMLKEAGSTPEELASGVPMRRLATPREVANCVLFLASDLSSYVTGTNFSVDGGNDATGGGYP